MNRTTRVLLYSVPLCMSCYLFGQTAEPQSKRPDALVRVPFVGCKSDGQVGPLKAPKGTSKTLRVSAQAGTRLAYYKSEYGVGVLAPRGWYCFSTYGSNGSTLYVSPEPIRAADLFSTKWAGFTGPAIQVSDMIGDTSGRFSVARTIARVFPAHMNFVRKVIAEGLEPADAFPSGPYPTDRMVYRSKEMVEYQTPANTEGLGTDSLLQKNDSPISGVAILFGEDPDLLELSVRLPPQFGDLTRVIIQQIEREAVRLSRAE
jgi:hypothetical protein